MTSPIFLQDLPIEQLEKLSKNDIQKISNAEQLYWNNKPHDIYYVAVHGAKSQNGGLLMPLLIMGKLKDYLLPVLVMKLFTQMVQPLRLSLVLAGTACVVEGLSVALVGSRLEKGDEIIESPNTTIAIRIYKDRPLPQNFLSHD